MQSTRGARPDEPPPAPPTRRAAARQVIDLFDDSSEIPTPPPYHAGRFESKDASRNPRSRHGFDPPPSPPRAAAPPPPPRQRVHSACELKRDSLSVPLPSRPRAASDAAIPCTTIATLRAGITLMFSDRGAAPSQARSDARGGRAAAIPSGGWFRALHPVECERVRAFFGVRDEHVLSSLGASSPPFRAGESPKAGGGGRSGALMWFTRDRRFVLKTMKRAEARFFSKIAKNYCDFVTKSANTLLPKFLAVVGIWGAEGGGPGSPSSPHEPEKIIFVMRNVFHSPREIHLKFDLKGSSVNRIRMPKSPLSDAAFYMDETRDCVYKDLDFIGTSAVEQYSELCRATQQSRRRVRVGPRCKTMLVQQLIADTAFLKSQGIMDYSFLLGIHNITVASDVVRAKQAMRTLIPLKRGDVVERKRIIHKIQAESLVHAKKSLTSPQKSRLRRGRGGKGSMSKVPGGSRRTPSGTFYSSFFRRDDGGWRSIPMPRPGATPGAMQQIYYFGIIDVLQRYTSKKMAETGLKGIVHDWKTVSSVPPPMYRERFVHFVGSILE